MNLSDHLDEFYRKYNIPAIGGVNDKTFEVPLPIFTLILPNFKWRKKMLHIHDLEHILNEQDTTWKGEMFIASWEISTGYWNHFPIIIFPLWTIGWGLWKHPSSVFRGFRKGHSDRGIANLNIDREKLLTMDLPALRAKTQNQKPSRSRFTLYCRLIFWILAGQIVFLSPLIVLAIILFFFYH